MADILGKRKRKPRKQNTYVNSEDINSDEDNENIIKPKKSRRSFTLEQKSRILDELKDQNKDVICQKYKLNVALLHKWKRSAQAIQKFSQNDYLKTAKKHRTAANEDLDNALYAWYLKARAKHIPVLGSILKIQAFHLARELNIQNFKGSEGWLSRWKLRKGVRLSATTDENKSVDLNVAECIKEELNNEMFEKKTAGKDAATGERQPIDMDAVICIKEEFNNESFEEKMTIEEIINCNKSSLPFNVLSNKTNFTNEEIKDADLKKDENQTTIASYANTDEFLKPKKSRRSFTLEQKSRILDELKEHTTDVICKKYKLNVAVLHKWKRSAQAIQKFSHHDYLKNVKKHRTAAHEDLENALYTWYLEARAKHIPVFGPILKEKALDLAQELNIPNFKGSEGWLSGWKLRKGVRLSANKGEKQSVDLNVTECTKKELSNETVEEKMTGKDVATGERQPIDMDAVICIKEEFNNESFEKKLTIEEIINCNESSLSFNTLLNKTDFTNEEINDADLKKDENRTTIAFHANTDEFLKPKKSRRSFTLQQKSRILDELKAHNIDAISKKYKLDPRVLRKWKKNSQAIQIYGQHDYLKNAKKNPSGANEDLDNALYAWYLEAQAKKIPISAPILKQKAFNLVEELNIHNFKGGDGWFTGWKCRKGVRLSTTTDEKQSGDLDIVECSKEKLNHEILKEKLNKNQVKNYEILRNKANDDILEIMKVTQLNSTGMNIG